MRAFIVCAISRLRLKATGYFFAERFKLTHDDARQEFLREDLNRLLIIRTELRKADLIEAIFLGARAHFLERRLALRWRAGDKTGIEHAIRNQRRDGFDGLTAIEGLLYFSNGLRLDAQ